VRATLEVVNSLNEQVAPGNAVTEQSLPGLLSPHQQILLWAALALADGAPLCLVSPAEPLTDENNRELWWKALHALATPEQTVALFSLPPARALSSSDVATQVVDVQASREVVSA
ncbi:MAG: hypothetical protein VW805_01995, partial [Pontimonas sp.]